MKYIETEANVTNGKILNLDDDNTMNHRDLQDNKLYSAYQVMVIAGVNQYDINKLLTPHNHIGRTPYYQGKHAKNKIGKKLHDTRYTEKTRNYSRNLSSYMKILEVRNNQG